MDEKDWWKSSTIRSVAVMVILIVVQMLQGDGQMAQTIDQMSEAAGQNKELLMQLGTLLAGGAAVRGRLKAKTQIKRKDAEK